MKISFMNQNIQKLNQKPEMIISYKSPFKYAIVPKYVVRRIEEEINSLLITMGEKYFKNHKNTKEIVSLLVRNIYEDERIGVLYNMNIKSFKKLVYIKLSQFSL